MLAYKGEHTPFFHTLGMKHYDHKSIEAKWQKLWVEQRTFFASADSAPKCAYVLDMFPYPSAQGLHVGHPEGYTATDIYCRYLRMKGVSVLHPMGWDAFGLPAENFAIKTGRHPREVTWENIENFRRQIMSLGFSYDWSREVNTANPSYYKWTQWLFLKLYEKGLAYRKEAPVNWCPSCQTVLANEQVLDGACERCGSTVEQRNMKQWFFKTTAYAEPLLKELGGLDWPKPIIDMQKNWIGKSEGALVKFYLTHVPGQPDKKHFIEIFTTRLDTIFGATFVVISPELAKKWIGVGWQVTDEVKQYVEKTLTGRELERMERAAKEKTGVNAGVKAINPATNEEIPVWVADYVLGSYGTGAIMAVPAHDARDFEFAKKFGLPIQEVVVRTQLVVSGVGVILKTGSTILLQHRDNNTDRDPGRVAPFGGEVRANEEPLRAAMRELHEELGIEIVESDLKNVGVFESYNRPGQFINMYFVEGIERAGLNLQEGRGIVNLSIEEALASPSVTEFTKGVLRTLTEHARFFVDDGVLVQSGEFSGLDSNTARHKIAKKIGAELKTQYRLRDWLISRQRYWGAPIPIIYCEEHGEVPVPEEDLPVELPDDVDFRPTGESPLVRSKSFHQVKCPKCAKPARRESDTMDTFVDSAWYFLRYCDPKNTAAAFAPEKVAEWCPVNLYVGGAEHAVLHLMYARFITKALHDMGYVAFSEPFLKLRNQGLILGEDGQKMSKSKGNVINPDDIVEKYGADTLRLYEMFMGPLEDTKPWNTSSIIGIRRFLDRVWYYCERWSNNMTGDEELIAAVEEDHKHGTLFHTSIKKITEDIEGMKYNTAIASLMSLLNKIQNITENTTTTTTRTSLLPALQLKTLLILLYPFAPHITSELWEQLKFEGNIWEQPWPEYDPKALKAVSVTIAVQVNGKLRGQVEVSSGASEAEVVAAARGVPQVAKYLTGGVKKTVYVPGRLVNFVASE